MVCVGIAAFTVADVWWLTVVLLVCAIVIGWYSVGLYAKAATDAAQRARHFEATPEDEDLLREVGRGRAHEEALRSARERDDVGSR